MNTCKTCKHWTMAEGRGRNICHPLDPDTYEPMNRGFETRLCKHPAQAFCEAPVESNGFALMDASEYFAVLATAEDFGCVRHEAIATRGATPPQAKEAE